MKGSISTLPVHIVKVSLSNALNPPPAFSVCAFDASSTAFDMCGSKTKIQFYVTFCPRLLNVFVLYCVFTQRPDENNCLPRAFNIRQIKKKKIYVINSNYMYTFPVCFVFLSCCHNDSSFHITSFVIFVAL